MPTWTYRMFFVSSFLLTISGQQNSVSSQNSCRSLVLFRHLFNTFLYVSYNNKQTCRKIIRKNKQKLARIQWSSLNAGAELRKHKTSVQNPEHPISERGPIGFVGVSWFLLTISGQQNSVSSLNPCRYLVLFRHVFSKFLNVSYNNKQTCCNSIQRKKLMSSWIQWNPRNSGVELHICNCSICFVNLRTIGSCELMRPAQDSMQGGTGRARQSEMRRTARHKQGQTTETICGPSHAEPFNLDNLSFGERSVVRLADPSFLNHFLTFLKKTQQNTKSAREFNELTELGRITVFSS